MCGEVLVLGFFDVLFQGLVCDGGFYLFEIWLIFDVDIIVFFVGKFYQYVVLEVICFFVGDVIFELMLKVMIDEVYSGFCYLVVMLLVQIGLNIFIFEFFYGLMLVFKDVVMQLFGCMMDYVLIEWGLRVIIVGVMLGDIGGVVIEVFCGREWIDIFILFLDGWVLNVQCCQMMIFLEVNVYVLVLIGNFDDCQVIVKGMFNYFVFWDCVVLFGVNLINWVWILVQIVYYFVVGVVFGVLYCKVLFIVLIGNFGDIFVGYVVMKMGLLVDKLVVVMNVNDIFV